MISSSTTHCIRWMPQQSRGVGLGYRKPGRCTGGGARLSGNELGFRVAVLSSRWERICLITCGSSILARACPVSAANALGITLTAPPHASQVVMSILKTRFKRCAFMPSGAGHRGMLLHRRPLIAVYLAFGALASFRRRHQRPVLAVWREHANAARTTTGAKTAALTAERMRV